MDAVNQELNQLMVDWPIILVIEWMKADTTLDLSPMAANPVLWDAVISFLFYLRGQECVWKN